MGAISCWLAVAVCATAMTYFIVRSLPRIAADDPQRRFWRTFAAAGVIFSAGEWIQLAQTIAAPSSVEALTGTGAARTVALALGGSALVAVLATYPLPHRSAHVRLCYHLDLATVVVAAGVYGIYWTVTGSAFTQNLAGIAAGPVVAMMAAFTAGRLYLSGAAPFHWHVGVVGPVAAIAEGVARALGPALAREGRPGLVFVLSVGSHVMLLGTAWLQYRRYRAVAPRVRRRPYSVLPYLALAAVFGLLVATLAIYGLDLRAWIILGGAVTCSAIVVARQLIAFIDNARLLTERDALAERLHTMAFTDSLTGARNRAFFLDALSSALESGADVGVMLVDLDDFKPVNDRFGHAAGDAVLVEAARRLRECVRDAGLVARLGGDEFAILLPDGDGTGAGIAERIVAAFADPFRLPSGDRVVTGASVGLAAGSFTGASHALSVADQAMYQAKNDGKGSFRRSAASA
ncbi:GGDEF domain-containing protein [Actinoplanes sp. NPDC023714]|uniref:GGDEF domain-containing protein n=1 Tax=Actinoplanes sp. NPDC023714 TaxID=3154322 RepID=UPI0033E72C64